MNEHSTRGSLAATLAPLTDGQHYRNVAFLLTSFPLGLAYFVAVVTGLSLGAGLAVLGIGLVVLYVTLWGVRGIAAFERRRVRVLLGRDIQTPSGPPNADGLLDRLRLLVGSSTVWRSVGYVVFVFGYGIVGFTVTVTGLGLTLGFLSAPLTYDTAFASPQLGFWEPTSLPEALAVAPLGVVALAATLYAATSIVAVGGSVAATLLGPENPGPPRST